MVVTFCPYCDEEIGGEIYEHFSEEGMGCFEHTCSYCSEWIEVDVEYNPYFNVNKKETYETV